MTKVYRGKPKWDEKLKIGPYVHISCESTYKGDEAPEIGRDTFSYTCEFREYETPPTETLNPANLIINGITGITERMHDNVATIHYPSLTRDRDAFEIRGSGIFCELKQPSMSQREMFCSNSDRWITGEAVSGVARSMGREWELSKRKVLTLKDVELD